MKNGLPKARQGLLTTDHSRRGRRCVTVLDPETMAVSVLEPWEHAVLVLCNGRRGAFAISRLVGEVEGFSADEAAVKGAIEFFVRDNLVELTARAAPRFASARPQSIAALQAAYEEWHTDPLRTSQILSARAASPFEVDPLLSAPPDTAPTRPESMDEAPTRHTPVVPTLRGATEPSVPPPAAPTTEEFFSDEPTRGVTPRPRADTEIADTRPAPARRRVRRRQAPLRGATERIDSTAEEDDVLQTLQMGEGLPRGRCPICLAEVPRDARVCPACRTRL